MWRALCVRMVSPLSVYTAVPITSIGILVVYSSVV